MPGLGDIVITGVGCVTGIGIGRSEFWSGLKVGQCAIQNLVGYGAGSTHVFSGAPLRNFDPKEYVTPRKALKVMSREVQTAYSAARLAWLDAGINELKTAPERIGVIYGTEVIASDLDDLASAVSASSTAGKMEFDRWAADGIKEIFPLWMLKNLPNMPACHVGIAIDARGPNNSIAQEEVSGLNALMEASGIIERGGADLILVGAVGGRVNPTRLLYRYPSHRVPFAKESFVGSIPFDRRREGLIPGEGAAALVVESRAHAVQRGAKILARVSGAANAFCRPARPWCGSAQAISAAISGAMREAKIGVSDLSHVCAQGFSHAFLDIEEATAIRAVLGDVPVTAMSGNLGILGAGGGLVELIGSLLALQHAVNLPIVGFEQPDSDCPVNVIRDFEPSSGAPCALKISFTPHGQASAVVIECMT